MEKKKVRLVFTAATGWKAPLAYLIRYLGGFEFSHVGVMDANDTIYEATFLHGVKKSTLSELNKTGCPYIICEVSNADYLNCMAKAMQLHGLSYDSTVIFYHFVSSFPAIKWAFKKPKSKSNAFDCAAHTATILHYGGVTLFKEHQFKLATVKDIYLENCVKVLESNGTKGNNDGLKIDAKYLSSVAFN
jgi:hypothetical protein